MWQKIADLVHLLFSLAENLRASRNSVERLEQEVRELASLVQCLAVELRHMREIEMHEREKLELRLNVKMLQGGGRLPDGK